MLGGTQKEPPDNIPTYQKSSTGTTEVPVKSTLSDLGFTKKAKFRRSIFSEPGRRSEGV